MAKAALEIESYRERVGAAVGMEVSELIAERLNDPRAALVRQVAAFLLLQDTRLSIGEVATILDKNEPWVRTAADYIERRCAHYYAFRIYVEQRAESYTALSGE